MTLKRDCIYYEPALPELYRAWCNKLNRRIKGLDCNNCGWYKLKVKPDDLSKAVSSELENKLKENRQAE